MTRLDRQAGFSLVEAMVALALTALTMTVGMSLLAQQSDITRRVRAHQEATRAIETTLENLRAGALPLVSGPVESPTLAAENEALIVWLEVEPEVGPAGLTEVLVEARYVFGQRALRRGIRTMVWRSQ